MTARVRVVDGKHLHLLFPNAGLEGERRVAAVLDALRAADLGKPRRG